MNLIFLVTSCFPRSPEALMLLMIYILDFLGLLL